MFSTAFHCHCYAPVPFLSFLSSSLTLHFRSFTVGATNRTTAVWRGVSILSIISARWSFGTSHYPITLGRVSAARRRRTTLPGLLPQYQLPSPTDRNTTATGAQALALNWCASHSRCAAPSTDGGRYQERLSRTHRSATANERSVASHRWLSPSLVPRMRRAVRH